MIKITLEEMPDPQPELNPRSVDYNVGVVTLKIITSSSKKIYSTFYGIFLTF